jgi:steroid delta-isomerase-like uncharacterized protein
MAAQDSGRLVERIFAAMNAQDWGSFAELLGPDYVNYAFPDARGPEGMRQVMSQFFAAFPDMHVDVEDVVAEGERAASRGVMHGTHRGDFMGIPATGKPVRIGYMDIWRFEDGKAVENWVQMDMLGMMQQLGVAPGPGQ